MRVLRVLVATEPLAHREALAAVLPDLRPRLLVHCVAPAKLEAAVAARPPTALVVCSRLTPAVRARAAAWVLLDPGAGRAVVGNGGAERVVETPGLGGLLAAIDAALDVVEAHTP